MNGFKIVPLSADYVKKIRDTRMDEFGHEVVEEIATGSGPCRVSLKAFVKGTDRRFLFSHTPFEKDNAFNQPGPVFIAADDVQPYADVHRFPPEIKANKKSFPLSLIGYNENQQMVFTKLVGDNDVDELIMKIFAEHSSVQYLHARNAKACCFICKIERA